jgi:hypothetical protein
MCNLDVSAVDIVSKKNFYFNGEKLRAFDFSKE